MALETPKRVLTKEKIDRQMSGQSSATPFVKVNIEYNYSSMTSCKKGVTFDAMETIEGNSDCIDKLTSLVSKMNIKMDKCEMQFKPQAYQGRNRGQNRHRQDNYQSRDRSYSRDRNQSYRGRGNYNRNYRSNIEVDHKTTLDMMIRETTIDMMIGEITTDKMIDETSISKIIEEIITKTIIGQIMKETIIENRDIELEVKVWKVLEIIIEIIQEKDLSEVEIEAEIGVEKDNHDQDQEIYWKIRLIGQDQNHRSRSNSRVSTNRDRIRYYRCREYDHFAMECPSALTDEELDHSDSEQVTLQMFIRKPHQFRRTHLS